MDTHSFIILNTIIFNEINKQTFKNPENVTLTIIFNISLAVFDFLFLNNYVSYLL